VAARSAGVTEVTLSRAQLAEADLPLYEGLGLGRICLVTSDARLIQSSVLKTILESPTLLKIGFGLGNDRSALKSRLGIELRNVLDLGEVLRGPGHRGTVGAKVAVAHFFGQKFQKSKKVGTSNWANPNLAERQLLYAANDAHVALKLYRAWLPTKTVLS
jgi:RNA polymerase sigma factor for flagellar operon FliA